MGRRDSEEKRERETGTEAGGRNDGEMERLHKGRSRRKGGDNEKGGAPESREAKVSGARIQQRWRQRWSDGGALIRHRTNAPLSLYTLAEGERTTRGVDMDGRAGAVPRYEKESCREKRATAIEPTQKSRKQTAFDRFRHTLACKRISARRRWTDESKDGD